ncbi:MAG: VWA domain-containing protein [Flavobacteriia bacterium]|nr:VWA domain-containing protein [Flavobacteriia bacterium]
MNIISEWSWWFVLLFLILSFGLTWYFLWYKNNFSSLPKPIKYLLFGLRFFSFFLLLILLMGLFVDHKEYKEEKPVIITLVDNSLSMLNDENPRTFSKEVKEYLSKIDNSYPEMDKKYYTIGEKIKKQKEFQFEEQSTNLAEGFEQIHQQFYRKNIAAVVLISDGNYNVGMHPVYSSSKLPFVPIYTVGVGSELDKKDQILKEVNHNEIAFYKNKFNVQVNVEAFQYPGKKSKLKILKNGKILAEKEVNFPKEKSVFLQENFELEANQIGFQRYEVELEALEKEYTLKNNRSTFYIEVLESRNKILLLSGAPHPDITALKGVLSQNENSFVEYKTIDQWDKNLNKTDLIVWHEPGIGFSEQACQIIQQSKIPILYFISTNTPQSIIKKLKVGLEQGNQNQSDEYQAVYDNSFQLFELSEESIKNIEKYPPLIGKYGKSSISKQNIVLFNQKVANISKNDALCFFGENEFEKYGVFLGEGIWKWKMSEFANKKNTTHFNELFSSINQYLVRKSNSSQLRVQMPKRVLSSEKMFITAEFYNEALERINKVNILFHLTDSKGKKAELEFGNNENQYQLQLNRLTPGIYTWKAFTEYNGKKHSKNGSFVIEDLLLEKRENKSNHSVLRDVSEKSKGKFYAFKNRQALFTDFNQRRDIKPLLYPISEVDLMLEFMWILLLLLLLLSSEWFLRRYYGLY